MKQVLFVTLTQANSKPMPAYFVSSCQFTLFCNLWLGVSLFLPVSIASAQQTKPDSQQTVWAHDDMREAQFPGGRKALAEFLRQNVHYPAEALRAHIAGRVFISFVIDTVGYITDITILKSLGYGCDEEAMRVVKAMPRWKPGSQSGKVQRVKYNLPVLFGMK